jgi:hypothetical protein
MSLQPRAVLVHRRSEYDELLARHGTRQQAAFFLQARGRTLDDVVAQHEALGRAMQATASAIPTDWRRVDVERRDLARFVFGPEDVIVVVGQDGLVANVAKYVDGQPVVGIDPDPHRNPGVLVPFAPEATGELLAAAVAGGTARELTMVEAATDDGQLLRALNEVYIGDASHQSARYELEVPGGGHEHQSSSGVLAGTGTGASGWLRSAWQERHSSVVLPGPTESTLCWFVREAWPSPATGTELTEGLLMHGDELVVQAESDRLVCFGDGVEADALTLAWGQRLTVRRSTTHLRVVDLPV